MSLLPKANHGLALSALAVASAIASCAYDFDAAFDEGAAPVDAGAAGGAAGADASAGGSTGLGGSPAQGGSDASVSGSGGAAGGQAGSGGVTGNGGASTGGSAGSGGASTGGNAGTGGTSTGGATGTGGFGGCDPGFANCDNDAKNGCEANLATDEQNCGVCGNPCGVQHTLSSNCVNGACVVICSSGYADCDGFPGNGCEVSLSSTQDCGECGVQCNSIHGTAACQSGVCQLSCTSNYADCNGRGIDGCEADTGGLPELCMMCDWYCEPSAPVCNSMSGCQPGEPVGYSKYFPRCADLPPTVTALPVLDLRAWDYSGSGPLKNQGTGGPLFDMNPGSGTSAPELVTGWPSYLLFDNTDHLRLASSANPPLLDSLHRDGAQFTLLLELWLADPTGTRVIASTGSFSNSPGMYVSANADTVNLQVGDGYPSGTICPNGYALCVTGLNHGASGAPGVGLFAGFSIDELAGSGIAWLNGSSKSFPATYATASDAPASHPFEIGGDLENFPMQDGTRLYRVRLWDSALSAAELSALESHSRTFCFW